jgi:hypothetical protein
MTRVFGLIVFCVGIVVFLHLFVYGDDPPCRPGGPDGNLYRYNSDGTTLALDKNGEKILVSGYSSRSRRRKCCDKKANVLCRNYNCVPGPGRTYHHIVTPYKLGHCENSGLLSACRQCYYNDSGGVKKTNKPACEKDTWYKVPPVVPVNVCIKQNKHRVTYNYDHSTSNDCF